MVSFSIVKNAHLESWGDLTERFEISEFVDYFTEEEISYCPGTSTDLVSISKYSERKSVEVHLHSPIALFLLSGEKGSFLISAGGKDEKTSGIRYPSFT